MMTTFAPELAPDITPSQPEIYFRDGVGIILGGAAVVTLVEMLPGDQSKTLMASAIKACPVQEIQVSYSQARSMADTLRPPEDMSWQGYELSKQDVAAHWSFAKTQRLHEVSRKQAEQGGRSKDGNRLEIQSESTRERLYDELSEAVLALAAAAIMDAPTTADLDQITAVYDAYPEIAVFPPKVHRLKAMLQSLRSKLGFEVKDNQEGMVY